MTPPVPSRCTPSGQSRPTNHAQHNWKWRGLNKPTAVRDPRARELQSVRTVGRPLKGAQREDRRRAIGPQHTPSDSRRRWRGSSPTAQRVEAHARPNRPLGPLQLASADPPSQTGRRSIRSSPQQGCPALSGLPVFGHRVTTSPFPCGPKAPWPLSRSGPYLKLPHRQKYRR